MTPKQAKKHLLQMKQEILHDEDVEADERKPVELDQSTMGRLSRMDAIQVHEMAMETDRRRKAELLRIEAALKRIEEGSFGDCVSCGEEIEAKRLESDPSVPTCYDCASSR